MKLFEIRGSQSVFQNVVYLGMLSRWGHRKAAIISFIDHKVVDGINCCVLDQLYRDLDQPKRRTQFVYSVGGASCMHPTRNI